VINKKYLVYAINVQPVVEQLEPLIKGSTRPRVNLSHIRELLIPTASLPEQERIVAKIEEVFTQLDAGAAALKRVRAGLKRYKASVRIVSEVERRLSVAAQVETILAASVARASRLRQSVLKSAFEGRLV